MKKVYPGLLTTLCLLLSASTAMAQSPGSISIKPPVVTPPSPTAQAFMRYGEIPVDYSTGVPNISIPLYTLRNKSMTVPISLSYHASGIKVNDVASEVGLGWVLNAGGIVARTVNGQPDERKAVGGVRTFANATQVTNRVETAAFNWDFSCACYPDIMSMEDVLSNFFDNEDYMSDRYFYTLPNGTSGVFTYDYSSMADDETSLITLPYRPLRIEKFLSVPSNTSSRNIDSLRITDDNGIKYSYGYYQTGYIISEWVLKRMASADGKDVIKFKYILQNTGYSSQTRSQTYYGPGKFIESGPCTNSGQDITSYVAQSFSLPSSFYTPMLDEIISSEAIVKFTYATGARSDFSNLKRLTGITVAPVRAPADVLKSIQLTQSYFGSTADSRRLKLDNVTVTGPGVAQHQQHSFAYESQTLPPYPTKMTNPTYSEDFWGYYNGANSNYPIPVEFILNSSDKQLFGGNRHADGSLSNYYAKACMLKEISYPTGGRTVFEFDRAFGDIIQYGGIQGGEHIGGFRVSSITNYNSSTEVANVKTYDYGSLEAKTIRKEDFCYDQRLNERTFNDYSHYMGGPPPDACWTMFTREMVFSSPLLPLEVAPGMPTMYRSVTEYNGTRTQNAGKTVYEYERPYSPSDYYSQLDHPAAYEMPWYYHPYHYDRGNYSPELMAKTEYAFDGTTYRPVSNVTNTYSHDYTREFKTGIKVSRPERYQFPVFFVQSFSYSGSPHSIIYDMRMEYTQSVAAIDTKAFQGTSLLTKTESSTFDPTDPTKYVRTTTEYAYNEQTLAVREQSTRTSTGEVFKTTYKYPHDFSSQSPYNHMVNTKHIWSPVIESNTYKTSTTTAPLESTKMRYDFWNGSTDQVYPAEVSTKAHNASVYESRIQYLAYDEKGNALSVSKAGDVPTSYIWGYDGQRPIAEARNATPAEIAYTSFEEDSPGGWTFNGSTVTTAFTGKRGYGLDGTSATDVRRAQLPAGTYELTMWAHGTGVPRVSVSGGSLPPHQLLTQVPSGWRQYRFRVSVPANGVVTVNSNQQYLWLDELRLSPVGAQVTSYTHAPLVGITSQTDPSGRTTFYEYDPLGRLQRVRDEQRNILSEHEYHYSAPAMSVTSNIIGATSLDLCPNGTPFNGITSATMQVTPQGGCGNFTYRWEQKDHTAALGWVNANNSTNTFTYHHTSSREWGVRCTVTDGCGNSEMVEENFLTYHSSTGCP